MKVKELIAELVSLPEELQNLEVKYREEIVYGNIEQVGVEYQHFDSDEWSLREGPDDKEISKRNPDEYEKIFVLSWD